MMLLDLPKEGTQKPYTDLIGTVIVITILREISLCLIFYRKSVLIMDYFYLCILDRTQGINYM